MTTFLLGNTSRFEVTFNDWDNDKDFVDPQLIKFIIRDLKFNVVSEEIITQQNKISTGTYFHFFTPSNIGTFYYEWYAEINGLPSLTRREFTVTLV